MESLELFSTDYWQPFAQFGLTHSFFNINKETVICTWVLLGILTAITLPTRLLLGKKYPLPQFLILRFAQWFTTLVEQALGAFIFNHFTFIASLFLFIFTSSALALIPGLEEPTNDINTTLALGLISFFYVQIYTIKQYGVWGYIKNEFCSPLLLLPLHIVGKLATIVSISFRLFGNIFGGATISTIYFQAIQTNWLTQIAGLALGLNLVVYIFFGLFEGFLQSFVFTMLTLTYLSIALESEPSPTQEGTS